MVNKGENMEIKMQKKKSLLTTLNAQTVKNYKSILEIRSFNYLSISILGYIHIRLFELKLFLDYHTCIGEPRASSWVKVKLIERKERSFVSLATYWRNWRKNKSYATVT